jgi:hypothetical protein
MKAFIFDGETAALPIDQHPIIPSQVESGMLPPMPEFSAASNLKDPDKIATDIEKRRDKWLSEEKAKLAACKDEWLDGAAICPDLAKVAAIGYGGGIPLAMEFSLDSSEANILTRFWLAYSTALEKGWPIIGFNHLHFDLPFFYWRSIKLGVRMIPLKLWRGEIQFPGDHIDLCKIAGQRPRKGIPKEMRYDSQDAVCKALGLPTKPKANGKDFALWPREEQEEYLRHDIATTEKIAGILCPWLNAEPIHGAKDSD